MRRRIVENFKIQQKTRIKTGWDRDLGYIELRQEKCNFIQIKFFFYWSNETLKWTSSCDIVCRGHTTQTLTMQSFFSKLLQFTRNCVDHSLAFEFCAIFQAAGGFTKDLNQVFWMWSTGTHLNFCISSAYVMAPIRNEKDEEGQKIYDEFHFGMQYFVQLQNWPFSDSGQNF